ncbi:MAG: CDP-alcohol phosphatidyltransferase family protein [Dethiosulfatibacter sp.]|nr:CDP-alcohol phosphatidyltransferase family protein [Dethiosulfatibacter sp.]
MIDTKIRPLVQTLFNDMGRWLVKTKIQPNQISIGAFVAGLFSAGFIAFGQVFSAIALLWVSGLLDVLDGTVARLSGKASRYGAYMDLIFDRLVESSFVFGFAIWHNQHHWVFYLFFIGVIFNFSTFMVAGALFQNKSDKSIYYDFGLVERTETFITFTLMALFAQVAVYILMVFNLLMFLTGIVRFYRIYQQGSWVQRVFETPPEP